MCTLCAERDDVLWSVGGYRHGDIIGYFPNGAPMMIYATDFARFSSCLRDRDTLWPADIDG